MRKFKLRPRKGDVGDEVFRIRIVGGIPVGFYTEDNPPPRTRFLGAGGLRCEVRGGLPDILMGEPDPANRTIYTGSAERAPEYDSAEIAEMRAAHAAAMNRESENELENAAALRIKKRLAPGPTGK